MNFSSFSNSMRAMASYVQGLLLDAGYTVVFGSHARIFRSRKLVELFSPLHFDSPPSDEGELSNFLQDLHDLWLAAALHETGHQWSSDVDRVSMSPLMDHLYGALEDVRVDSRNQLLRRGAKAIFNKGYSVLMRKGYWREVSDQDHPASVFQAWVLYAGRARIAEQESFETRAVGAEIALAGILPADVISDCWNIMLDVRGAASSQDVVNICARLCERLGLDAYKKKHPEPDSDQVNPNEAQSDSADQNQCGEDDASAGAPADQGEDEVDGSDDPTSEGAQAPEDDESDQPRSSTQGSVTDDGGQDPEEGSSVPNSGKSLGDSDDNSDFDASSAPASILEACEEDFAFDSDIGDAFDDAYRQSADQAKLIGAVETRLPATTPAVRSSTPFQGCASAQVLGIRIERELDAMTKAPVRWSDTGSVIGRNRLTLVPLGETRVFRRQAVVQRPDTAVMFLADTSYSMKRDRLDLLKKVLVRVSLALHGRRGIAFGAMSFPVHVSRESVDASLGQPSDVHEVLPVGSDARFYIESIDALQADYGTPLDSALKVARMRLSQCKQPRKVLIVGSDGEADDPQATKDQIAECRKAGIEVIGLGIQCDSVSDYFDRYAVIQKLEELEATLVRLLASSVVSVKRAA